VTDLETSRAAWIGDEIPGGNAAPKWPVTGVAIEGDFSGIQRFVSRPVPGASGAARRLRARSFRVLALTRLVSAEIVGGFRDSAARQFYSAGGRFLLVMQPCSDWQPRFASIQQRIDSAFLDDYRGELVFHLAGAEFGDGKIPVAKLAAAMAQRRCTPLREVLCSNQRWQSSQFVFPAAAHGKCEGCGATAKLVRDELCQTCLDDRTLGAHLLTTDASLTKSPTGTIRFLGDNWDLSSNGSVSIPSLSHLPLERGQLATFENLAARALGRPYLAYLRIDADKIGEQFRLLAADPRRTWGLSSLLDRAFSQSVSRLIQSKFPNLYPVYGGGDDLFIIGPWNDVLDFAQAWHSEFQIITGGKLTFSAGVALAKPRQHILTKSDEAEHLLNAFAKTGRDSIHALGQTLTWAEYTKALDLGKQLAQMHAGKQIKSAILRNILDLRERCDKGDERWHSLLFYQVERNLEGNPRDLIKRSFLNPGDLWKSAAFIVRYTILRAGGKEEENYA